MESPDFIPDDQFKEDQPQQQAAPNFISDDDMEKQSQQSPKSAAPDFIPDGQEPQDDSQKYSTPGQQAEAVFEGAARGITGGLSDALAVGMRKGATALGVPDEYLHYVAPKPEEMAQRKEQNPLTSGTAELAGNIALMSQLPQIGSKAINGMIQMGLISGGDEISKSMLGQGDPIPAVASHIAGSMAAGLVLGKAFGVAERGGAMALKALEDSKMGNKLSSFISGIGHAATFPEEAAMSSKESAFLPSEIKNFSDSTFRKGQDFYKNVFEKAPKEIGKFVLPMIGGAVGGIGGTAASIALEQALERIAPKLSQKYVGPAVLKAASSGSVENLGQIIDHATTIEKGAKKISNHVESLFKGGSNKLIESQTSEKDREKLKEFIENGGVDQQIRDEGQTQQQQQQSQGYAEGGEVKPMPELSPSNPIAKVFPEQNTLLSAAKGRVSGYLNSVRPQENKAKLPMDTEIKDKQKENEYNKTLDLANNPMSILKHVKDGTLLPKHMKDFSQMYPELHSHLSNKITERLMKMQANKETRPPYKTRQSMSLFLGTSLDSTLTPQGMMAAQNVFAQQKAQNQAPASKTSSLGKIGKASQTAEQFRTQDLTKS